MKNNNYQAYLIRFKRSEETLPWRATLVNVDTNKQRYFATEQEALAFLLQALADPAPNPYSAGLEIQESVS